ncbi:hypothetical protein GCM10023196_070400 [Actinoallomurus vinaceus]|uniref:MPT63-like domain-containing protein n=1 Tax=Actinoallomurus vinaceus TaxID=1080074 RepID=A0ABP8UKD9_9ACTN
MSIAKSLTVALSVATFGIPLLTGTNAYAVGHPVVDQAASKAAPSLQTAHRTVAGRTVAGVGWEQSGTGALKIHVDTTDAHFNGTPIYVTSIAGVGNQFGLVGTSSVYSPAATGFDIFIRWADGHAISPADAISGGWYVQWIGVENP